MDKLKGSRALQIKCSIVLRKLVTTPLSRQSKFTIAVEREYPPKHTRRITERKTPGLEDGILNVALKAAIKATLE